MKLFHPENDSVPSPSLDAIQGLSRPSVFFAQEDGAAGAPRLRFGMQVTPEKVDQRQDAL
jgi:hypothetical protein